MNRATMLSIVVLMATGFGVVNGNASTITFNDNPNGVYGQSPIFSGGFTATSNPGPADPGYYPLGTNYSVDNSGPSNGTIHLDVWTNGGPDSIWTLTKTGGGFFSLSAFDFASGYTNGSNQASSIILTGITSSGSVTETFTTVNGNFNTYLVNSLFSSVSSVRFDAIGRDNRSAYDNIVVNQSAVPEPSTWAMMILGFAGVGFMAYRRRAQSGMLAA